MRDNKNRCFEFLTGYSGDINHPMTKYDISCFNSSGYDCEYVTKDGKTFQRNIIGNHVSLVNAGRAGHNVAIRDPEMPAFSVSKRNKLNKAILNLL